MTSLRETAELEVAAAEDRTRHSLALYYRALCGEVCSLIPYDDGSSPWEHADTETTVWLPREAPLDDHAEFTAAEWYQVAMTHRAMHRTLGTFELDLDKDEPLFARMRPRDTGDPRIPSLQRLAGLFGGSVLGVHVFATCEDLRIDAATDRLLPGLARPAKAVHHGALHERPQPATLFPRAAAIEALVRFSLGGSLVWAATQMHEPIARILSVARMLRDPRATVESSVEAALRICDVLVGLPTHGGFRATHELRFADLDTTLDESRFELSTLAERLEGAEGFAGWYHPVAYRDWPGPRYVGAPASDASLEAFLPQIAQASTTLARGQDDDAQAPAPRPQGRDGAAVLSGSDPEAAPDVRPMLPFAGDEPWADLETPMTARARNEFVYPEWDSYAATYRPAFTRVRVLPAPVKRADHSHYRALARYGHLVGRLVRELERVRPDGRTATRRTLHGDDLDLDACIDAVIDLRTGVEPSDRIYTDVRQRRRDVAVVFALDLSASTAVVLPPDPESPGTIRSILDLERDAVSLVAQALERVGDDYGIYGFSGSGRDDVRLSVVKDVEERTTPAVWHRLGGLTPDHTTRIAPAIRHLTERLRDVDAATKIMFVISDGRPFDIDYGQQYGEQAMLGYSVGDTAKALAEARAAGVSPYLVTVDPDGADYLSTACEPGSYHVIADTLDLPEALATLYTSVRASS
jgi:Mg-chelatase subunit ChlD